jgi:hypothetical protein
LIAVISWGNLVRPYVRAALVVLSGVALALPTAAPANATTGPWVELDIPAPFANVQGFVHGHIAGATPSESASTRTVR